MAADAMADSPCRQQPLGRRQRVFALREWLRDTFGDLGARFDGRTVLDVAGGRGDLSWLLANIEGVDSVVVDPRPTDHSSLSKSVAWLRGHPDVAAERAVCGRPCYQPLAALLDACREGEALVTPRHIRTFLDAEFVCAVDKAAGDPGGWAAFWSSARSRALALTPGQEGERGAGAVRSAEDALDAVRRAGLVVGFHPDQATEACIDLATVLRVPFAVCPCCVFPAEFPGRRLPDGTKVTKYPQLIAYLKGKHPRIRVAELPFQGVHRHEIDAELEAAGVCPAARSTVLYTLPEDM